MYFQDDFSMEMKIVTRQKLHEFNEILSCSLCNGYIIEATTINTCFHTCNIINLAFIIA